MGTPSKGLRGPRSSGATILELFLGWRSWRTTEDAESSFSLPPVGPWCLLGETLSFFLLLYKAQGKGDKRLAEAAREGGGREGEVLPTQADTMNPVAGILLCALLGAAFGKEAAKASVTHARRPLPAGPPESPGPAAFFLLLGNRMRCYDCGGGGPRGSCQETVTTCREGERCGFLERKPQPQLGQTKLSGNRESPFLPALACLQPLFQYFWLSRTFQAQSGSGQMVPLSEWHSL